MQLAMSNLNHPVSNPQENLSNNQKIKRRRLHGACDACRYKKIKCDSSERPGNICSNCEAGYIACTHVVPYGPTKAERQKAYIKNLQDRVDKLESYFQHVFPNQHIDRIIEEAFANPPGQSSLHISGTVGSVIHDPKQRLRQSLSPPNLSEDSSPDAKNPDNSDESEAEDHNALSEHFSKLSLEAIDNRYFGQSSGYMFGKVVSTIRKNLIGNKETDPNRFRRQLYWDYRPWERAFTIMPEVAFVYPEPDLLQSLALLYFEKVNSIFPILHRPTFMRSLNLGQHHWDSSFGMTVLQVCALGSRYSNDSRVTVENDTIGLSSGWNYFKQAPLHRRRLFYETTLYDLQYYFLASMYCVGTSIPHAAWNLSGLGMRCAIERGIHRRKAQDQKPTVESELWKRAFWCLLCLDRMTSSHVGRPCLLPDEEYDAEYPIECDDEYWETGDSRLDFKQPAGKPCKVTGFVFLMKLHEILGFVTRILYPTKKSNLHKGEDRETRIVSELDSAMNKWKDSLPDYLRWDDHREDDYFFHQSVLLFVTYYYAQIQIHRPFLTKKSSISFASLAMCTNAARSCSHVLEVASKRGLRIIPSHIIALYTSGLVITLNLWGFQRSGMIENVEKNLKDLQTCLDILAMLEDRWNIAGRLRDILTEVSSISDYKPPQVNSHPRKTGYTEPRNVVPMQKSIPLDNSTTAIQNQNWDVDNLDNLLFYEMDLLQANYMNQVLHAPQFLGNSHQQVNTVNFGTEQSMPPRTFDEDMLGLWSDLHATFSNEEWDAYLASTSQKLAST